jgi:hypothetical protein
VDRPGVLQGAQATILPVKRYGMCDAARTKRGRHELLGG